MLRTKKCLHELCPRAALIGLILNLVVTVVAAHGQDARAAVSVGGRSRSQASIEADKDVALSAEKITELLKGEPGLLIQVKRRLVEKAYAQGRLLDPADLTDEALFELLRRDPHTRAIATLEIEDREYIRAKPTREEREREERARSNYNIDPGAASAAMPGPPPKNQEEAYWAEQDRLRNARRPQQPPTPTAPSPSVTPPQQQLPLNRQVEVADASSNGDMDYGAGQAPSGMQRVSPQELPGLFASGEGSGDGSSSGGAMRASMRQSSGTSGSFGNGMSNSSMAPGGIPASPEDAMRDQYGLTSTQGSSLDSRPSGQANLYYPRTRPRPLYGSSSTASSPVITHRADPYANVPALYDLYAQVAKPAAPVERFGADIFRDDSGQFEDMPIDMPVGPDYVLGPGDNVRIDLWGGVSQRLLRVVGRDGRVALPEVGPVLVAGKSLGEVQKQVQAVLRTQFRDVQADISLGRLRSVRVYVVGFVMQPGAYDISSLSTPLNALIAAGGPSDRGSVRKLLHFRGKELIEEVDGYDLILRGVRDHLQPFQPGDTVMVPAVGPQVKIEGMVRRPAIYELHDEKTLADVLELAGGVLPTGTLRHIQVDRLQPHVNRTMLDLDLPEGADQQMVTKNLEDFKVQDGDAVRISPILSLNDKTVYLEGHVFRPGRYPYKNEMTVSQLVNQYGELLPEPYRGHAEVVRLNAPDYRPLVIPFNLGDALAGKDDIVLKPFDTVRVFGRYDFEDPPIVTVSGEVRDPGDHRTNGDTHLSDAVYLAGGLTPDASSGLVQVFRKTEDSQMRVLSVNLGKALAGDPTANILLRPKDRVIIQRNSAQFDPASVQIRGEVENPGKYPLGAGMSAAELVKLAGGVKRGAYLTSADLTRYVVENGKKVEAEHRQVAIGNALNGDSTADVPLRDGDVLAVRQIGGWNDIGASITVSGEVLHPGTYGITAGEKLSSILKRAGGFRTDAYPYGAVLERMQVKELSEQSKEELIRRIEAGTNVKPSASGTAGEEVAILQASIQQQQQLLNTLKTQPANGRLVVRLSPDINRWKNTADDIEVRAGDTLLIPKKPNFVLVSGQVYHGTALTYVPGRNAGWYLRQAGGPTSTADTKGIFVVRADGSVISKTGSGMFSGKVLDARLQPGDMIVVPEKLITGSNTLRDLFSMATIGANLAIAARVATSF